VVPETEARAPETKRLRGGVWLLLTATGLASFINFGGGSAAVKKAKKGSSERRKSRKGRKPHRTDANDGKPLFGDLTMAPLAQVFKDGGSKPPTAADIALVFTPVVLQHLLADPVGPGGKPCDGFNQSLLLEFPLLEPPLSSKCNCMEWAALKDDFDADFRRLRQADLKTGWSCPGSAIRLWRTAMR
jgi:hypothetical protein